MDKNKLMPVNIEPVEVNDVKSLSVISKVNSDSSVSLIERADSLIGLAPDILEAAESSKLFKVEVPDGFNLNDLIASKKGDGTLRALVRDQKGLNGDVSLRPNALNPAQLASVGLSAAAMVVGQAYMTEINDKLEKIDEKLDTVVAMMLDDKKAVVTNARDIAKRYVENYDEYQKKPPMALQAIRNEIESRYNDVGHVVDWLTDRIPLIEEKARTAKPKEKDLTPLINELHAYEEQFSLCLNALSALAMTRMYYDGTMDEKSALSERKIILEKSQRFMKARQSLAGVLEIKIGSLKGIPISIPHGTDKNAFKKISSQTPRAAAKEQLLETKIAMQSDLRGAKSRIENDVRACQDGITRIATVAKSSRTILTDGSNCWLTGDSQPEQSANPCNLTSDTMQNGYQRCSRISNPAHRSKL